MHIDCMTMFVCCLISTDLKVCMAMCNIVFTVQLNFYKTFIYKAFITHDSLTTVKIILL